MYVEWRARALIQYSMIPSPLLYRVSDPHLSNLLEPSAYQILENVRMHVTSRWGSRPPIIPVRRGLRPPLLYDHIRI